MNKKLAILGCSYLQIPLIKKASELGIETHCFAWLDGAVGQDLVDYFYPISVLNKEEILKKCQDIKIDGICSIASDVVVPTWNFVAAQMGLISNPQNSTLYTTNKFEMRQKLSKFRVSIPKFLEYPSASFRQGIDEINFPLIVKPKDRSGSKGITLVSNPEKIKSAINTAIDESFINEAIVEEFIEGRELSIESISWEGRHFILAMTDKVTTGSPSFVEIEHHQPAIISKQEHEMISKEVVKALDALEIEFGASHTEVIIDKSEDLYIVEVGARMGGDFIGSHLTFLSTGYDYLKAVIELSLGEFKHPTIQNKSFSGVYFLTKENEPMKQYFASPEKYNFILTSEFLNDEIKYSTSSSDRSAYFIYKADKKISL